MIKKKKEKRIDNLWMKFKEKRKLKEDKRMIEREQGMYYKDVEGNKVIDGKDGIW